MRGMVALKSLRQRYEINNGVKTTKQKPVKEEEETATPEAFDSELERSGIQTRRSPGKIYIAK